MINKVSVLQSFDYMIDQLREKQRKAIENEDWWEVARLELYISGLEQGHALVTVAKENGN